MIQRAIFRQCRAFGTSGIITPNVRLTRLQTLRDNGSIFRSLRQIPAVRWYATEPELRTPAGGEAEVAHQGQAKPLQGEDRPVKKELEAQNREILELKVSSSLNITLASKPQAL